MNNRFIHFKFLPMSLRMAYTMTLLVLGTGYLFAMIQVFEVHAGRDGNPSLSANDLRIAYSGNPSGSRLESALHGPMQGMLPAEERQVVIEWVHDGASQEGYEAKVKRHHGHALRHVPQPGRQPASAGPHQLRWHLQGGRG
jgi:hypothetical protein